MKTTKTKIGSQLTTYFASRRYPVVLAYLFGSQAEDQATPLSDLDVAVYLETNSAGREAIYLHLLSDLAGQTRTEHLDLVYLNDASPLLAHRIIKDGHLLYASDEARRIETETAVLQRYFDHQELYEAQHRYLRQRIRRGKLGQRSREMIDEKMVNERLQHINEMLELLRGYSSLTLEEFKANREKSHAALYELQTCLEAMTDISNHLVAALNLRKPEDRGELMTILAEEGIIPKNLAASLTKAIGLRNVIVHGYLHIALNIVHKSLQQDLGDIEEFCRHIVNYLEKEESGSQ